MGDAIVVGTDGSDTATTAVQEAIRLASALRQPLHIVSAYRPIKGGGVPPEFEVRPDSAVESVLADASSRARMGGVEAEVHARVGDAAEVILDLAEELDAALIVIGNKGIDSVKRFVLGNVPSKIAHHAPCSTYIVHTS